MQLPTIKNLLSGSSKQQYSKYLALMPDLRQEKAKKFTTIVLTLITSIILGLFAISPTLSTIANLQKQISDDQYVDQKLQEKIDALATLQQKYADIQNDLPIIYNAVPTSTQIPTLMGEIQSIAQSSDLKLDSFQVYSVDLSKTKTSQNYSTFDFGFAAEGTYQQIISFMDNLINFQRIVEIDNTSISKQNSTSSSSDNLQLSVKGTVFFKQ